ncbi:MAG: hypothetical protein M1546_02545 [Chloroflexi bacterium]|nr:hypothetical protein [Chloroflexota bacterium]
MAPTETVFRAPAHPYTVGLLHSAPNLNSDRRFPLQPIDGVLPDLINLPPACPFSPRCGRRTPECDEKMPALAQFGPEHLLACYHPVGREA